MGSRNFKRELYSAITLVLIVFAASASAGAQTETVLYNFSGTSNDPLGSLILDASGNLYGASNGGAVFELMPSTGGSWTEKVIYDLSSGQFNYSRGSLVFDARGNLYGTSLYGGTHSAGTVFELTPSSDGTWTRKVLHTFGNGTDGQLPNGALIFDAAGNLYGTTYEGGTHKVGMAFKLMPLANGGWKEVVLHQFGAGTDGTYPLTGLLLDASGNLFGTTDAGGTYGASGGGGTLFELSPQAQGGWKETILHNFGNGTDGGGPYSVPILDSAGNLYGTTSGGGTYGFGTAFELIRQTNGGWKEKILHNFGNGSDGIEPGNALLFDKLGNLYGSTGSGGADNCTDYYAGTVFELTPTSNGQWTETNLESFCDYTSPAGGGVQGIVFDPSGNIFGTTYAGGTYFGGTAFEITP